MEEKDKIDVLQIVLEAHSLSLLRALNVKTCRFKDLQPLINNDKTLSIKLKRLKKYRLLEIVPISDDDRYFTGYKITERGKKLLKAIEDIKT
jgi:DNA-binding HxlR family transcriptional regulator